MRTSKPVPSEPGNCSGWWRAYDTSELILPRNLRPSDSGTSTMSRGIDTIDTVWATGSSETTIIVSVRYVLRPTPESTPMIRPLIRGTAGVAEGSSDADGSGEPIRRTRVRRFEVVGVRRRRLGRTDGDRWRLDEDLVGRLARDLGRVAAVRLRNDDEQQDEGDRQHVAPARSRQGRVPDARPDGDQPPDEEQALDREEAPDDLGREQFGDESWRGRGQDDPGADEESDDDRGQEDDGPAATPGDEVAETRDQGVEDRRHVARAETARVWGRRGRRGRRLGVGGRGRDGVRIALLRIHGRQSSRGGRSRVAAVQSRGSTGEWPSGKAPDSGSGDRRFESFLASQLPHG